MVLLEYDLSKYLFIQYASSATLTARKNLPEMAADIFSGEEWR